MEGRRLRIIGGTVTLVLVLAALAAEALFFSSFEYRYKTKRFNTILAEKERYLEDCLDRMKPILAADDHHGSISENNLFTDALSQGVTILEYLDDKLNYWSDNDFDVPRTFADSLDNKAMVFLQNGWFLTRTIHASNEKIVGLLRIHTDYEFENEIISDGFYPDFRMPSGSRLSLTEGATGYEVRNSRNEFLFSIIYPEKKKGTSFILLPLLLWAAVLVMFLITAYHLSSFYAEKGKKLQAALLTFIAFLFLYLALIAGWKERLLSLTELFNPAVFSTGFLIPSAGHLLILSILACVFSYILFMNFPLASTIPSDDRKELMHLLPLMTGGSVFYSVATLVFKRLVSDSPVSFETYRILEISPLSIAGYSSVLLLMLAALLYHIRIFRSVRQFRNGPVLASVLISLSVPLLAFSRDLHTLAASALFYLLITLLMWIAVKRKAGVFNLGVIFSLLLGLFSLYVISFNSERKRNEMLKIQAVALSTENDPEAEQLLLDLWPGLNADTTLAGMMDVEFFTTTEYEAISAYLLKKYFTGYWRNFNLNIVLCRIDDPINVGENRRASQKCFDFFEERINQNGQRLTGTGFYFLENQGGRSFYTGKVVFRNKSGVSNGVFIELFSDVNVFQPGYSELLLEKNYHGYANLKDFSFAKYINGRAVLRAGTFPYDDNDSRYLVNDTEFRSFNTGGVKHLLYRNGNSTVMISRPVLSFSEVVISFAYLFAYIFLFFNLLVFIVSLPLRPGPLNLNLRRKIQLAFIAVLLFSFVAVGVVVATFTIGQYKTKLYDNLKEKVESIYLELEGRIASEKHLTAEWRGMNYESLSDILISLSNVFLTDINIFDVNGFLIATSRPEIFSRDLTSRRMNNMAMISLIDLTNSEFFQREKIGRLEYMSAYVPFYNTDNQVIAYLNLPYFRMQSVLAREISNLIVAVINFTLLMIVLTMSIAVIISRRLTAPLSMLGSALASVEVGKKSEHLNYGGHDEIAELVRQYNMMVDEIDESTRRLADSEREYAWREMARQIAHEIKNPLTPMRLNVQQLLKSWKDKAPGFDRAIEKFAENQIENIDNLSSIASAFSSFARMPETAATELNLLDQVKSAVDLFRNTENFTFSVNWPEETRVIIFADREQLKGIFSNIFKNAIQSVPDTRHGVVETAVTIRGDRVIVSVSDNGTGIPEDLRKKMFTPNFTTKSSGTGLGLSIVKKYIESVNGRIWYESEPGSGTTFFLEFPLLYTVEKPA